jgi:hypothetical protein
MLLQKIPMASLMKHRNGMTLIQIANMNERIGKLAVEAGAHWDHGDWNMPSAVYFSERDLEKFARLIVQECIWAFGETRTEPSLEKYILDRLGINHE